MNHFLLYRIVWIVACVIALAVLPWWMFAIIAMLGNAVFPSAYEVVLFGAAADAVYATASWAGYFAPFMSTAIVVVLLAHYVRARVR